MRRLGIALGTLILVAATHAEAASLDQETCTRLKTELLQLELTGARANMAKGPDWAKGNLPADKLEQIKRLVEVDEQLLFRCQGKPLVMLPEGVDVEPPPADAKDDPNAGAKPQSTDQAAKAAPRAAVKAGASASGKKAGHGQAQGKAPAPAADKAGPPAKQAAGPGTPLPAPKPKPKAKPKVDDAYKPPPVPPGTDPFAGQQQ
jgi:hypothetical protein